MPEKDPTTWTAATWLLALGMAFGGGAVNWYAQEVRRDSPLVAGLSAALGLTDETPANLFKVAAGA